MPFDQEEFMRQVRKRNLECPLEERLVWLATDVVYARALPEHFLRWLKPEERLLGLTPEQRLEGLTPDERVELRRLLDDPASAGFAHSVFVATT